MKDANVKKLYIYENFEIDNETVAIFALEDNDFGKSIVFHQHLGIFFVDQTTKQLINKYKDHHNWHGFMISRTFSKVFDLKGHLPIVDGINVYLPLSGSKGRCPDWVGLHQVIGFQQKAGYAEFVTRDGEHFRLKFPGHNLHDIIHKACFISECHVEMIKQNIESFAVLVLKQERVGLSKSFKDCRCKLHCDFQRMEKLAWQFWTNYFAIALLVTTEDYEFDREQAIRVKMNQFNKKTAYLKKVHVKWAFLLELIITVRCNKVSLD
ncbi:hypothetical protein [Companilactobacillus furfuricola]|uniref:hypothetical protein n=1 Tax=Companilactobacillus furfuricola TaxID=1462575 RepID=UPI0013DDA2E0|nr:hypothetical protein [Companilactobacillus furfuricola]